MKNYNKSDWAVNKFARGIVYRGQTQTVEVTLEDFLAAHPGLTEQDFHAVKSISDTIYCEQVYSEYNQTRKNVPIDGLTGSREPASAPLEEQYEEKLDKQRALKAVRHLLAGDQLTEVQRRRFTMHFFGGLSLGKIASIEGVAKNAIAQSINACTQKLKKSYKNFCF